MCHSGLSGPRRWPVHDHDGGRSVDRDAQRDDEQDYRLLLLVSGASRSLQTRLLLRRQYIRVVGPKHRMTLSPSVGRGASSVWQTLSLGASADARWPSARRKLR
jgi:hypothetical protein